MDNAVSHLRKSCYLELRKIANIRSYLRDAATLKLVLSLVISKLDYCNSLFYNMRHDYILSQLYVFSGPIVEKDVHIATSTNMSGTVLLRDRGGGGGCFSVCFLL